MYIISPLSQCASPEKRDKFLEYIKKIAPVTLHTEPNCYAYAWFRSAGDNTTVPSHWLRGFEVYETAEANQVAHRASDEYKAFRAAVSAEGLLSNPSDLRFWHPTGLGFLNKGGPTLFVPEGSSIQYIVTDEFVPKLRAKSQVFEELRSVVKVSQEDERVLTFWVQDRIGTFGEYPELEDDGAILVLVGSELSNWLELEDGRLGSNQESDSLGGDRGTEMNQHSLMES
ncbi:hypothetical protein OPT61_g6435 [Boeremia exigua]|uniref:Uncharacterized protein n=1 Tax=Boeremia exigua TaxID=749465 RepID=A0ACC2I6N6_9PLEO|nr:hypothetical protein OPT61_g6435 [Boeremia exigua]